MAIEIPYDVAERIKLLERELKHAHESRDMFCKRSADYTRVLEMAARQMATIEKMDSKIKRLESDANRWATWRVLMCNAFSKGESTCDLQLKLQVGKALRDCTQDDFDNAFDRATGKGN